MEKGFWKKVFTNACVYFAVIIALILIVYTFTSGESIYKPTFSVIRTLMLLCFCIMFSMANRLLSAKNLNGIAKLLLHFLLTIAAFLIFIYAPLVGDEKYRASLRGVTYKPLNIFAIIGVFIFIYAIAYGIYFVISSKKAKKENVKSEYQSLYKNKTDK